MSVNPEGCYCEYASEASGGLKVVCQYCYDQLSESLRKKSAAEVELREALSAMLKHYVELVESGDAGNWDAETEPEVKQARAVLAKYPKGAKP